MTYLNVAEPIEIHLLGELLLNCLRRWTTRPTPKIITLAILILLRPVQGCRHSPHNQITEHGNPCESRSDRCRLVRFLNAELVAEDDDEVEQDRDTSDEEVHPRRPSLRVFGPSSAALDGAVGLGDVAVDVLSGEEFLQCNGYGDEDCNGDQES